MAPALRHCSSSYSWMRRGRCPGRLASGANARPSTQPTRSGVPVGVNGPPWVLITLAPRSRRAFIIARAMAASLGDCTTAQPLNPINCFVEGGHPVHIPQRNMLIRRIDYCHHHFTDGPDVLDFTWCTYSTAIPLQVGQNDIALLDGEPVDSLDLLRHSHCITVQ